LKPTVVRNPAADREFERAVNQLLDSGVTNLTAFEAALREQFPRATVRPRDLAGEDTPTWYAYREGRWIRGT
jgi:hypothetical protein